jgi:hypothetical protein
MRLIRRLPPRRPTRIPAGRDVGASAPGRTLPTPTGLEPGCTRQRSLVRGVVLAVWLALTLPAAPVLACPVCTGGLPERSLAQQLADAERAVLANPTPGAPSRFTVVAAVMGESAVGEAIVAPTPAQETVDIESGKPALLVRDPTRAAWTNLGSIGTEHQALLRRIAALPPIATLSEAERRERVAFFYPYLEHAEPLLAQAAYHEIARAPYGTMRSLRPKLDTTRLWTWVDDPQRAGRYPLYYLLIGVAGNASDGARIEERIARRGIGAQTLAAMLVADLELRGESRVEHVERAYILDRDRTLGETQAALLALSVHGNEGAPISRARVIQAYRLMIEHRAPLAGFVAPDLAAWEYWDVVPDFVALLRAGKLHPASRFAIVNYLRASPRPEAQAALRELLDAPVMRR